MWVSGFYGSGKSSFTKYLGFALDPDHTLGRTPFVERLVARFRSRETQQALRTVAGRSPAKVVLLDLGSDGPGEGVVRRHGSAGADRHRHQGEHQLGRAHPSGRSRRGG